MRTSAADCNGRWVGKVYRASQSGLGAHTKRGGTSLGGAEERQCGGGCSRARPELVTMDELVDKEKANIRAGRAGGFFVYGVTSGVGANADWPLGARMRDEVDGGRGD